MNDKVRFSYPCDIDRSFLLPVAEGDYCRACNRIVIDFTHLTDEELVAFLRDHAGKGMCGTFRNEQVDKTHLFGKRFSLGVKSVAASVLAVFGVQAAWAQQVEKPVVNDSPVATQQIKAPVDSVVYQVRGMVKNNKGMALNYAHVSAYTANGDFLGTAIANRSGEYVINVTLPVGISSFTLQASASLHITSYHRDFIPGAGNADFELKKHSRRWIRKHVRWRGKF